MVFTVIICVTRLELYKSRQKRTCGMLTASIKLVTSYKQDFENPKGKNSWDDPCSYIQLSWKRIHVANSS